MKPHTITTLLLAVFVPGAGYVAVGKATRGVALTVLLVALMIVGALAADAGHVLPVFAVLALSALLLVASIERFPGHYAASDAALFDRDGQLWVTGRLDDVINVAGHRLGTMELEAALLTHAAVSEAAVVTQPDDIKGTVPVAFVVPRAGHADSEALRVELSQAIVDAVGAIARPARIIVVSTVPRTRSGKIMRRVLRDLLLTGEASGDLTSLDNPDAIDVVRAALRSS